MNLGDIELCPAYVHHVAQWDVHARENPGSANALEERYEGWDEGGVSRAMGETDCVVERCQLLLVHSVLHLLNYDHEEERERGEMERIEEWVVEGMRREGVIGGGGRDGT